jgi:hypothetical protein
LQRLFSTLNRINRQDRRRLDMSSLEELTIVQRDAPERDVLTGKIFFSNTVPAGTQPVPRRVCFLLVFF